MGEPSNILHDNCVSSATKPQVRTNGTRTQISPVTTKALPGRRRLAEACYRAPLLAEMPLHQSAKYSSTNRPTR